MYADCDRINFIIFAVCDLTDKLQLSYMENGDQNGCKLLYNTERKSLKLPEYGRNVQKMVEYLRTIPDREKRNEQARAVVKVMEIVNPQVHLQENFEQKLWDHLYIIADFNLDVDSPYPMPNPDKFTVPPDVVPVSKKPIKATHYGRNIENIIDLIAGMEEGEARNAAIRSIAVYMRQQYLIWNKDSVADETIFHDIEVLSEGRIHVPEDMHLSRISSDANFSRPGAGSGNNRSGHYQRYGNQRKNQRSK